jgi:hypothetical protein
LLARNANPGRFVARRHVWLWDALLRRWRRLIRGGDRLIAVLLWLGRDPGLLLEKVGEHGGVRGQPIGAQWRLRGGAQVEVLGQLGTGRGACRGALSPRGRAMPDQCVIA